MSSRWETLGVAASLAHAGGMSTAPTVHLFVYGTLMRGESNAVQMVGAEFLGGGRTTGGWTLVELDGYPGLIAGGVEDTVIGEVWRVSLEHLQRLDQFEGVDEGLYRRRELQLMPPWADQPVMAYHYAGEHVGRRRIGGVWRLRASP